MGEGSGEFGERGGWRFWLMAGSASRPQKQTISLKGRSMGTTDRLYVLATEADDPPQVGEDFQRGLRNALVLSVVLFWAPVIFAITWMVNR
jgi:hypothetical protein